MILLSFGLSTIFAFSWDATFSLGFSPLPNPDDLSAVKGTDVYNTLDITLLPQRTCMANVTPVTICIINETANKEPKFHM